MADMDFSEPLDNQSLCVEVANGAFAFKNKIKASTIRLLWDKLSIFIAQTLRTQKGVLLPNLGNFRVGPVVGEMKKKIRPAFSLLEGRYGSVSQERAKYQIGGRPTIVQPNYGLLSTSASVHRGSCQRLISELLQRLGVHIMSGRPINVEFPTLGRLLTNRVGRIEFVFAPLFLEYFEREQYALIKEMDPGVDDDVPGDLVKGLQQVYLDRPPSVMSPASRPMSAATAVSKRGKVKEQEHAPYKGTLLELWKLCKKGDRINSGCVPRIQLEEWLHKDCRGVLRLVDGATLIELLSTHTYGKTKQQIMYRPFLDALDSATLNSPMARSPRDNAPSPRQAWGDDQDPEEQQGLEDEEGLHEATAQDLVQGGPQFQQQGQYQQQYPGQYQQQYPGQYQGQYQGPGPQQQQQQGYPQQYPPQQYQQYPYPGQPPQTAASTASDVIHYYQNQLSPRSRVAYDAFNKAHFDQLFSSRGPAPKRAVTPKVGEEPLNLQQYQVMRQQPPRSPGPVQGGLLPPQQAPHGFQRPPPISILQSVPQTAWATPRSQAPPPPSSAQQQQPHPQVMRIQHPGSPGPTAPPPSRPSPISQYDIMNEADPRVRKQKKDEYAAMLQQGWNQQIQEKHRVEEVVSAAQAQWPYAPLNTPADKRPLGGISRPPSPGPPRRAGSAISRARSPRG